MLEAEAQRGFQQQLGTGIAGLLSSGFQTAQQQAQQAFENQRRVQQQAAGLQLAGGELTGIGQLFGTFGVQAPTTQANLATQLKSIRCYRNCCSTTSSTTSISKSNGSVQTTI